MADDEVYEATDVIFVWGQRAYNPGDRVSAQVVKDHGSETQGKVRRVAKKDL